MPQPDFDIYTDFENGHLPDDNPVLAVLVLGVLTALFFAAFAWAVLYR